jgi:signal transduction histidine kinase
MEYFRPGQIRYRYRLKDQELMWNHSGSSGRAVYNNPAPGRYVLELSSTGRDGTWINDAPSIKFPLQVKKHPLARWWAVLLYLLAGGAGLSVLGRSGWIVVNQRMKSLDTRIRLQSERTRHLEDLNRMKDTFLLATALRLEETVASMDVPETLKDVKEFARLQLGEGEIRPEPMYLHQAADSIRSELAAAAAEKDIEIRNDIPMFVTPVRADAQLVRLILRKLLLAALQFSDRGPIRLSARISSAGADIRVQNSTLKLSPDIVRQLKSPSVYLEPRRAWEHGGFLISWLIARGAVELHSGELTLEMSESYGTIFRFTLPAVEQSPALTEDAGIEKEAEQEEEV